METRSVLAGDLKLNGCPIPLAKNHPMSFILRILNLILPGLGSAISGRCKRALVASIAVPVVFISGAGFAWVETRTGWLILLSSYIGLGAFSSLGGVVSRVTVAHAVKTTALYISSLIGFGFAIFYLQAHITGYSLYLIPSNSMAPTIKRGDIVLVKRIKPDQTPKIGEVVVFADATNSTTHYIKRIARKPFSLRQSAEDQYFVLGDNAEHSLDSRYIGLVDRARISEAAKIILLSVTDIKRALIELSVK